MSLIQKIVVYLVKSGDEVEFADLLLHVFLVVAAEQEGENEERFDLVHFFVVDLELGQRRKSALGTVWILIPRITAVENLLE